MTFLCVEPVGAKAPTFSMTSKSYTFVQSAGDNFALLCQAQAFPVPLIRCVIEAFLPFPHSNPIISTFSHIRHSFLNMVIYFNLFSRRTRWLKSSNIFVGLDQFYI